MVDSSMTGISVDSVTTVYSLKTIMRYSVCINRLICSAVENQSCYTHLITLKSSIVITGYKLKPKCSRAVAAIAAPYS